MVSLERTGRNVEAFSRLFSSSNLLPERTADGTQYRKIFDVSVRVFEAVNGTRTIHGREDDLGGSMRGVFELWVSRSPERAFNLYTLKSTVSGLHSGPLSPLSGSDITHQSIYSSEAREGSRLRRNDEPERRATFSGDPPECLLGLIQSYCVSLSATGLSRGYNTGGSRESSRSIPLIIDRIRRFPPRNTELPSSDKKTTEEKYFTSGKAYKMHYESNDV